MYRTRLQGGEPHRQGLSGHRDKPNGDQRAPCHQNQRRPVQLPFTQPGHRILSDVVEFSAAPCRVLVALDSKSSGPII